MVLKLLCVCVCERKGEKERDEERKKQVGLLCRVAGWRCQVRSGSAVGSAGGQECQII